MSTRIMLATFTALAALGSLEAQAQRRTSAPAGNPVQFNNPLAQANMYNASSGPLKFNNPLAQSGMYSSDPGLFYNNPLNQVGMYDASSGPLQFNNPLNQGNMYGSPVSSGLPFNNRNVNANLAQRTQTSNNLNGLIPGGLNGNVNNSTATFNSGFGVGAVSGGFQNPMQQGVFGWGGYGNNIYGGGFNNGTFNNGTFNNGGFNNGAFNNGGFNGMQGGNSLIPNGLNPNVRGPIGNGSNANAAATLNGATAGAHKGSRSRSRAQHATSKRR